MNIENFIQTLQNCLPQTKGDIALHEPHFCGNEWQYVKECLDTGWVSSGGKFVDRFEADLAKFTGAKHCVVAVNGTAALHIIFLLAGVKPQDEVLVPALTFSATCHAIDYCGGIPHFVDSEARYLGIDVEKLENYLSAITEIKDDICFNKKTGRPVRALCAMHTFGHPVDIDPLLKLCERYHLLFVEDAAEALGSFYKKQHVGHFGFAGALSFNGNKTITTGGGGAILTDDDVVAKKAKHLTTTAKVAHPWRYDHDQVGYNYRLPNINAALGCAQLECLPEFLKQKRLLAAHYRASFENFPGMCLCAEPPFAKSNYWLNAIALEEIGQLEALLTQAHAHGLKLRPVWTLANQLPAFRHCPAMDLSVASVLEKRLVNLPSSAFLMGKITANHAEKCITSSC